MSGAHSFQEIILRLQSFWSRQGCAILQPHDGEVGAGTFHSATFLRAIGPEPWRAAYVQPSRRPQDGRYGDNPNRLQRHHQFQVVMKPPPADFQDLLIESLAELGVARDLNDIRFMEDDWESPTLGAWGIGWELRVNGLEVAQFTYFQEAGGLECGPVMGEITCGLERLAMLVQGRDDVREIEWAPGITYGDVSLQDEREQCRYNFEESDPGLLARRFDDHERESGSLAERGLPIPAYEHTMRCSHLFNLLDARGALSVTERAAYIRRVRKLARTAAQAYLEERERLGFPLAASDGGS